MKIQAGYQTVAFKKRDELPRGDYAALRMNPSDQRLQSYNLTVRHIALRLEIIDKLIVIKPTLHLGKQEMVFLHFLHHPAVETAHAPCIIALYGSQGNGGPVVHGADRNVSVLDRIQAKSREETGILPILPNISHDPVLQF